MIMGKKSMSNQNEANQSGEGHILGTYFNMAYENYHRTMRTILAKQLKVEVDKDALTDVQSLTVDQPLRLRRLLFRHLPFLAPIMDDVIRQNQQVAKSKKNNYDSKNITKKQKTALLDNSIEDILDKLRIFAEELEYCRNRYTHKNAYNKNEENFQHFEREKSIAQMLEALMKAERELLKNRKDREKNSKAMRIFLEDDFKHYFKKRQGISVRNNQFYFNPDIFELNKKGQIDYSTIELSKFGRFYFCSLFLRPRDAERFAQEMQVFIKSPWPDIKDDNNPPTYTSSSENKVMREVMQMHRIRVPREKRIDAIQTKGTLLMDILEELRRCPKLLYDTFEPKTKSAFNHIVIQPDGSKTSSLMVRHQDRFSQLALRYIDQNNLFDHIRFQLRLGLFCFRFYDKLLIDGTQCLRTVHKELNGFGRWQEVEEKRVSQWGRRFQKTEMKINDDGDEIEQLIPDSPSTDPYVTDWRTTYNIHAGRIGMTWGEVNVNGKTEVGSSLLPKVDNVNRNCYYIPELPEYQEKDGNNIDRIVEIPQEIPLCTLSIYDLPALLFYQYLIDSYGRKGANGNKAPLTESVILEKYYALKSLLEMAKEETCSPESLYSKQQDLKLADSEIPVKLLSFMKKKDFNPKKKRCDHVKQVLEDMINDIEDRLESFDNKKIRIKAGGRNNRYGNPHHADVRHGSLARYLMRSLLKWQPINSDEKHQGKLTSINARSLMASISVFGIDNSVLPLREVLKNAGMIDGKNPHPFITNAMQNSNNIEQLYVSYLKEEKKHINTILADVNSNIDSLPPFLRCNDRVQHWGIDVEYSSYIRKYAKRLLEAPISLPDGLFTAPIAELLLNAIPNNKNLEVMADVLKTDNRIKDDGGYVKGNIPSGSASHIIGYYFEKVLGDKSQKFYDSQMKEYKRFYENISKLKPRRKPNKELIPDYFTQKEIQQKIKSARKSVSGKKGDDATTLRDKLNQVEEKERRIRRHRIEDIVLFLSSKQMLLETVGRSFKEDDVSVNNLVESKDNRNQMKIKAEKLKLQDFSFDEDFQFLSEGDDEKERQEKEKSGSLLDYEYPYKVKNKGTITIKQKGLSLKNYGNIYSVLGDERMESLMVGLYEMGVREVTLGDIMAEFANFDSLRSAILKLLQDRIEQMAFDRNRAVLTDNKKREFYSKKDKSGKQIEMKIIDPKTGKIIAPSKDAIRNQFPALIALLKEYDQIKDDINDLRKAVAHNHYPKGISKLPSTNKKKLQLPNITHLAKVNLEKEIQEAQEKQKKDSEDGSK